jgi:ubiquinone/menaquinone biosynthesis C-methylase UbiE/cytosine/adenosine deaminase-related metal-dependent hydrolase
VNGTGIDFEELTSANAAGFAAWAPIYDTQVNPLLALEERFLRRLLPSIDDKDVLDVGCGTGRWIEHLARLGTPRSLCGIDGSDEMLGVARAKSPTSASLLNAQLPHLPLPASSIDLAIASFVLSYVPDIDRCARELARVLRVGGEVFVTDMHPQTATELGWRRGFSSSQGVIHLHTDHRSIESTVRSITQHGLRLVGSYLPSFGEPEHPLFVSQGKEGFYQKADGRPAIYLLHFRRELAIPGRPEILLGGTRCVIGSQEIVTCDLELQSGRIRAISSSNVTKTADVQIDLSGYTVFPGLINAHDHLDFALFPRLGTAPYRNATEWAHDIQDHACDIISLHKEVPKAVRLWWGALRNLLCGVTTVCHHNPSHPTLDEADFPIRVVTEFGWDHSLAFANDLQTSYRRTNPSNPFILHACEGIDAAARSEFSRLQALDLIDDRTVFVHGLAMAASEIDILNRNGGSLVSCPSSNQFLFSEAPSLRQLDSIHRLAIGSDSPLTAEGDLLDEVGFCSQQLHLPPERLFDCVTEAPARILRLKRGEGRIALDGPADMFAVRSSSLMPAPHLTSLTWRDVELVLVDGIVRIASTEMLGRLPGSLSKHLSCVLIDGTPRWLSAPVIDLFQAAAQVLGTANVALNGRNVSVRGT